MLDRDPLASPLVLGAVLAAPGRASAVGAPIRHAATAERAGLDLVVVASGGLDAPLVAARIAAETRRIGIVAEAATTTSEPFHVSTQIATIDTASGGRGGWLASVVAPAAAQPSVSWRVPDDVLGDAAEHVQVVRALWDSWEQDAEIRDAASGRFLDRERVHRIDFRGRYIAVRGPSITPRPPQGHPVVAVRVDDAATWPLAARHGDVAVTATGAAPPDAATFRGPWIATVAAAGRAAESLVDEIAARRAAGAAGVLLGPVDDLDATLAAVLPELERRGLRASSTAPVSTTATTLRARLGLVPAANRWERAA